MRAEILVKSQANLPAMSYRLRDNDFIIIFMNFYNYNRRLTSPVSRDIDKSYDFNIFYDQKILFYLKRH